MCFQFSFLFGIKSFKFISFYILGVDFFVFPNGR